MKKTLILTALIAAFASANTYAETAESNKANKQPTTMQPSTDMKGNINMSMPSTMPKAPAMAMPNVNAMPKTPMMAMPNTMPKAPAMTAPAAPKAPAMAAPAKMPGM